MLFAPIYIAMTFLRSWRIRSFRAKLLEFLGGDTSVAFCKVPENAAETPTLSSKLCTNPKAAYLCDLFFYTNVSRVCSMKPVQCIDLADWVACAGGMPLGNPDICEREWEVDLLLECEMEPHNRSVNQNNIPVESIGQPVAWKAGSHLAIVLRSTIELLSVSGFQFVAGEFVVTRQLPVVRIQTVQLSGEPNKATDPAMRSLRSEIQHNLTLPNIEFQWSNHASLLRKLSKVVDIKTETRNILNGTINGNTDYEPNTQRKSVTLADVSVNTGRSLNEDSPTETEPIKYLEKSPEIHKSPNKNASNLNHENSVVIENVTVEIEHNITPNKSSLRLDLKKGGYISASLLNMSSQIKSVTTHKRVFSSTAPKEPEAEAEASSSTQNVTKSLRSSRPLVNTKSPNVLIYSDSKAASENLEASLRKVLDCDRYTVYSINSSTLEAGAWRGRCSLIAMAGAVGKAAPLLLTHLLEGGRLLALCSDLLHTVLPHYKTAEVRENEIVQVSYDRWKSVKMKHHIFCYQASPAKKQFSTESDAQVSKYVGHRGQELEISVLASEQTWHTASLLQATHPTTQGRAIFSQIHLEASPADYLSDPSEIAATESARLQILHKIVGDVLGLSVKDPQPDTPIQYTRGYFLGNHVDKLAFVNAVCREWNDGRRLQKLGDTTVQYCMRNETPMEEPSEKFLPVFIYECPDNFSTVQYFDNLTSTSIGRLVIYSDVLTSTQKLAMGGALADGVALVAGRQAQGRGRGGNCWLSHKGQACITVQLHMKLTESISLVQHCAALAAVLAVRTMPGYEELDIRLKWPNDIYYGRDTKIGGNLTTATCVGDTAIVNTGTGVNISNSLPTTCLNDIIAEYNRRHNTSLPPLTVEAYLATYCSHLEQMLRLIVAPESLVRQYRRYWLHDNEQIKLLRGTDSTATTATIIGLDNAGWLLVRTETGEETTVAPDGNTFDIMTGLIAPKY